MISLKQLKTKKPSSDGKDKKSSIGAKAKTKDDGKTKSDKKPKENSKLPKRSKLSVIPSLRRQNSDKYYSSEFATTKALNPKVYLSDRRGRLLEVVQELLWNILQISLPIIKKRMCNNKAAFEKLVLYLNTIPSSWSSDVLMTVRDFIFQNMEYWREIFKTKKRTDVLDLSFLENSSDSIYDLEIQTALKDEELKKYNLCEALDILEECKANMLNHLDDINPDMFDELNRNLKEIRDMTKVKISKYKHEDESDDENESNDEDADYENDEDDDDVANRFEDNQCDIQDYYES